MTDRSGPAVAEAHAFCREVEAHLCRRNEGHLIRIVGPSFDLVKAWADQGVPIGVVREAIDRVIERAARRPGRRRPIRIEFCEADVLDGYDRWRRAVGVVPVAGDPAPQGRRESLAAHVERVSVQLAALLGSERVPATVRPAVQAALTALDGQRAASVGARGAARDVVVAALAHIDERLIDAVHDGVAPERRLALTRAAERDLDAYRGRLTPGQWDAAVRAERARLMRAEHGLPTVTFD